MSVTGGNSVHEHMHPLVAVHRNKSAVQEQKASRGLVKIAPVVEKRIGLYFRKNHVMATYPKGRARRETDRLRW